MSLSAGVFAVALVSAGDLGQALAHPGGTDSSGCHVQSSTGIRHCHGEEGEPLNTVGALEMGIEAGRSVWVESVEVFSYYGSFHAQPDGTALALGGFGGLTPPIGGRAIVGYMDAAFGFIWVAEAKVFPVLRASAGLRFQLYNWHSPWIVLSLKVGLFVDFVADGTNAEPAGLDARIAVAF